MTTCGVGVGEGDGDGEGLGDTTAADGRACVPAWAALQAVRANARSGAIAQKPGARIIARGFYARGLYESIRGVLTFPRPADSDGAKVSRVRQLFAP